MSIWKSPVFYFGIVLTLVVVAALAAPFVVPWNNYRSDLETFGRKITGRDVSIGGDIAVKLFPYPQLEAREVTIGNPGGFANVAFVQADVVRVRLSLGGLFNGALNVESVETEKPIINLQRNASGDVNWIFVPEEQVVGAGLLSRVKLDQIDIRSGVLSFDDLKAGHSTLFTGMNAVLSAQNILGPWRMKGQLRWEGVPLQLTLTTSAKESEKPISFTLKVAPDEVALPQAALEGTWDGKLFEGAVRVDPQAATGQKTSVEGTFKPLSLQAKVEATEQRLSLLKIRIAPSDRKDSGTLIEGDAILAFGAQALAQIDLKSPRINLDTLLGAAAMQQWRDGGVLQVANQLLGKMPAKMVAEFKINVSTLTSGGQALNDVRLSGNMQPEAIRVHEFAAELPGRSTGQFNGIIFPGENAAQLGGKLTFQSQDMRSFLSWFLPDWKSSFATHWTGSRGQLNVINSSLDWSLQQLSLNEITYEFDGVPGNAQLSRQFGAAPKLAIKLDAGAIDIDSLVPNGWSVLRDGGWPTLGALATQQDAGNGMEKQVSLRAKSVLLNGVTAENVDIGFVTGPRGFQLQLFNIKNVGGAKLSSGGSLVDQGNGPEGDLSFKLDAQDSRGFLRLAGLEYGESRWADALGQTLIEAKVTATPQKSGPEINIVTRGASGLLNMELVASVRDLENGRAATVAASGGLNSGNSAVLAKLVGIVPAVAVGPGDVTFEFKGSLEKGFVFATTLKALDAVAKIEGSARPQDTYFGVNGVASLAADNGLALAQAVGIPLAVSMGQKVEANMKIEAKDGGLLFSDVTGQFAGRRFSGVGEVLRSGGLQADLETDFMDVREALALVLMPWDGPVADRSKNFVDLNIRNWLGEVFIRPMAFTNLTALPDKEVVVGFGFEKQERRLSILSPGEQGLKADVVLKPRGDSFAMSGEARWPIDLAKHMKTESGIGVASGQVMVEGAFTANGRSPAAMLAALEGKGTFTLTNARLPRLTTDGFAGAVLEAKTPEGLSAALQRLDQAPGTEIGDQKGSFTIVNGEAVFSTFKLQAVNIGTEVSAVFDAPTDELRVVTTLTLPQRADLPPVTVTYAGSGGQLKIRNGSSALAAKLGYELLSKEMAALEKLQKEQQVLLAKEEAQRVEDANRFADYQATKAELRGQTRVRRFHATQRALKLTAMQAIVDDAVKTSTVRARQDLARHARRLAVRRATIR
jgi:uncharacterized protein involved in outer membrane biogenesis